MTKDERAGLGQESAKFIRESETFVTVIKDGFKYTYFDGDGGREMLIDLTADYGEMKNIASEYPTKMAELKKIAMGYERKIPATKIEKSKNKQSIKNRQNKKNKH